MRQLSGSNKKANRLVGRRQSEGGTIEKNKGEGSTSGGGGMKNLKSSRNSRSKSKSKSSKGKGIGHKHKEEKSIASVKSLQRNTTNNIVTVEHIPRRDVVDKLEPNIESDNNNNNKNTTRTPANGSDGESNDNGKIPKKSKRENSRSFPIPYNETITSEVIPSASSSDSRESRNQKEECTSGGLFDFFGYVQRAMHSGLCGGTENTTTANATNGDYSSTYKGNAVSWNEDPSVLSMDTDANSEFGKPGNNYKKKNNSNGQSPSSVGENGNKSTTPTSQDGSYSSYQDGKEQNIPALASINDQSFLQSRFATSKAKDSRSKESRQENDSDDSDDNSDDSDSDSDESESGVSEGETRDKVPKNFLSSKSGQLRQNHTLTITVDHGKGKDVEDVKIDMNSVHFSGWDGDRSHYSLAISPAATPLNLNVQTGSAKRHQLGKALKRKGKSLRPEDLASVDGSQLSALSADVHPLRSPLPTATTAKSSRASPSPNSNINLKKDRSARSFTGQSPVVHLYDDEKRDNDSVAGNSNCSGDEDSVDAQSKSLSSQIFSLLSKLNETPQSERQKKKKKRKKIVQDVLNPKITPMGEEESEMILGFLGSESGSTAASDNDSREHTKQKAGETTFLSPQPSGKPPLSTQGSKLKMQTPSKQSQTPSSPRGRGESTCSSSNFMSAQKSYILEEQHGTVFLKASPNKQPKTTPKLKMKKLKKKHKSSKGELIAAPLEPGWRKSAAKGIPRAVSYTDKAQQEVSPMLVEDYSPAVKVLNLLGWATEEKSSPTETHASATNRQNVMAAGPKKSGIMLPFFQNESLNINLFASPEPEKSSSTKRYGLGKSDSSQTQGAPRNEVFGSYMKQCIPTFDSRLRQQAKSNQRRKCIMEGWMLFLIGNEDFSLNGGIPSRNWLRYVVLSENSHTIFAYDSVGPNAKSKSIDLSRGRIALPSIVSTKLGHAVVLKSETTSKTLCTILPIPVSYHFFTDESLSQPVEQNKFEKVWSDLQITTTQSRSDKRGKDNNNVIWGDPNTLTNFAPLEQHNAFLHLYYTTDAVIHESFHRRLLLPGN